MNEQKAQSIYDNTQHPDYYDDINTYDTYNWRSFLHSEVKNARTTEWHDIVISFYYEMCDDIIKKEMQIPNFMDWLDVLTPKQVNDIMAAKIVEYEEY